MSSCCGGGARALDKPSPQTRFAGGGAQKTGNIRVPVYSEEDVARAVAARPGYRYTRAFFGPTTSILTFTPKDR
jgi:hypothetical protein